MMAPEKCKVGKNSVIVKIESVLGKSLILPTLKKGIDKQKVSLGDFGEPPFCIRLPHNMLRKHNSTLASRETPFENNSHLHDQTKISAPSAIETSDNFISEQNGVDETITDTLNKDDSDDFLDACSVLSKNADSNDESTSIVDNNNVFENIDYSVLKELNVELIHKMMHGDN